MQIKNEEEYYTGKKKEEFRVGELVAFIGRDPNGEIYTVEIGKIKSLFKDGAFVYYHTGGTAAKTRYCDLYKIRNEYAMHDLGGEEGAKYFASL